MKRGFLFALAMMALGGATARADADDGCQLLTVGEWQLRSDNYMPVVDGAINGHKVSVLLDTGSFTTFVTRSAATKFGLSMAPSTTGHGRIDAVRLYGINGVAQAEGARIEELRIADWQRKDWIATVADRTFGNAALLLGYEFFHQLDVEFDLAHGVVRLFQPKGCDRAWLAYWTKEALTVPLEAGTRLQVPVRINGQKLVAELDSGAGSSVLSLDAAVSLGITPQTLGVTPGGCVGSGPNGLDSWIAPLDGFAIGDEVIRNPNMRFTDLWRHMTYEVTWSHIRQRLPGLADMLLGVDFLRSHRVYVAHSQGRVYFSYTGGTVFPTRKWKSCAEANS